MLKTAIVETRTVFERGIHRELNRHVVVNLLVYSRRVFGEFSCLVANWHFTSPRILFLGKSRKFLKLLKICVTLRYIYRITSLLYKSRNFLYASVTGFTSLFSNRRTSIVISIQSFALTGIALSVLPLLFEISGAFFKAVLSNEWFCCISIF